MQLLKNGLLIALFILIQINSTYSQLTVNGDAIDTGGDCYQLTTTSNWQIGSAISTATIDLTQPFELNGFLNFGNLDNNGADGIAFLFASTSTAVGIGGGGMGYEGITPAFIVECDTWQNGPGTNNDPAADHIAIQQNGDLVHGGPNSLVAPISMPNLEDGQDHCFSVTWTPATQTFVFTLDATSITYVGDISAIFGGNTNVHYGFTGGTGGSVNLQTVCITESNAPPPITFMSDITICEGESVQLQADPSGNQYTWTFDPTLSETAISNPTATPTSTTTYSVQIDFACSDPQFDDVTVFVLPQPSATASNNGPICAGETLELSASGGFSYQWMGPNGFNSTSSNPNITISTPANSGLYTVTVTDGNGCTAIATTAVTVTASVPAEIQAPTMPVCFDGAPIQLTATPPNGSWGGNASSTGLFDPTGLLPGDYSVTYFYFSGNNCSDTDEIFVSIVPGPSAFINSPNSVCIGGQLNLFGSGGGTYAWTGPNGFNSPLQNPTINNFQAAQEGTYILSVTDTNGCTGTASLTVVASPPIPVSIDPPANTICQGSDGFQMTATPSGGTWGGAADISGFVDPSLLNTGDNQVSYFYTDNNDCSGMDEITITILSDPEVSISNSGPFCDSDGPQQLQGTPANGNWSGFASNNGIINPSALGQGIYEVFYFFTDANGCMGETSTFIEVFPAASAEIVTNSPYCQNNGIQLLGANPSGGTWGGAANAAGEINPSTLAIGMHEVTYSTGQQGSCGGSASVFIEIIESPTAVIFGMETICSNDNTPANLTIDATGTAPIQVIYAIDGLAQTPINISAGTNNLPVTEAGVYTILDVTDANCEGTASGTAEVIVVDAPQVINLETTCDMMQENYTVTFEIIGGETATYEVTGDGGVLTGSIFTSNLIPSGENYAFDVFDGNNCEVIQLSDNFSCACVTNAGTMNTDLIVLCEGEAVSAIANNDETLDANDHFIFVLHDGNGNSLGTIFDEQNTPTFSLLPNMMTGVTYYISALAGNDNNAGGVDDTDACLSVAFGTPVQWQPLPTGTISDHIEICEAESAIITFNLTGASPFDVIYSENGVNNSLDNILNGHTITVTPSVTSTYELVEITDNSAAACQSTISSSITITVNTAIEVNATAAICESESILLAGEMQNTAGVYSDTLNTVNGCDSIIFTTLTVHPIDTTYLTDTDCNMANVGVFETTLSNQNNCDSLIILTVSFSSTDTTLINSPTCDPDMLDDITTTFTTPEGCDSIVIESFFLIESDTTEIADTSCNPDNTGVFETLLTNQDGCDSLIILTIDLVESDTTEIADTSCNPDNTGVFETLLTNQDGCDSLIILTIDLVESDTTEIADTSCNPDNTGVFETLLTNQDGCDSLIILTIDLVESDTTEIANTSCNPDNTGVFETLLTNQDGCDSLIILTIDLVESDTTEIADTSCNPDNTGVFETLLTNQDGCDSLIILTIDLVESDTTEIADTSCNPDNTGVFETLLTNQDGCDSLIILTIDLVESDTTEIANTSCNPDNTGVFETLLTNQDGCDSLIILTIDLVESDTTEIADTSCNPDNTGVFETLLTNQDGCDSLIILTIDLVESDTTEIADTSCNPDNTGVFETLLTNQDGCDSLIILTVMLSESNTIFIDLTTCNTLDTGTVVLVLTNQFNCDSTIITTTTLLPPNECGITGSLAGSEIDCNETTSSLSLEMTLGTAPFNYSWTGASSGTGIINNLNELTEITDLPAGEYAVEITDANGFSITLNADIIQLLPPIITATITQDIDCFENMNGSAIASATAGQAPYTFEWSTNETTPAIDNLFAATYTVTVTDANDCTNETSIILDEPTPLEMSFIISNIDCFEASQGSVEAVLTGGEAPYQFAVNGGAFQSNASFNNLTEGAYQITAQDAKGCTVTEAFAINAPIDVEVSLGDDMQINIGDAADLNALVNIPLNEIDSLDWGDIETGECPSCPEQTVMPIVTTTYSVTVLAENGCSGSDDLTVFVNRQKSIFAPTVFSPNNDGNNDLFLLFAKEGAVKNINSFTIYSRWGEAVYQIYDFQANDPVSGWDGNFNGTTLNPAVFVWFAEVEFIDGEVEMFKGDVTLVR